MPSPLTSSIAAWNERFAIAGVAAIVTGQAGLPLVRVTSDAAAAEVYLQGAQVTSWQPARAQEVLFLSRYARWEDGKAIRGGIPICFPWFRGKADNPEAPAHGVVRTRAWQLDGMEQSGEGVTLTLSTTSDERSRRWFPHEFHLEHRITVGRELTLELKATNTGEGDLRFEEALHTYFHVDDAATVQVSGLEGTRYLDNMDQNREKLQVGDVVFTGQTDNAYLNTHAALALRDPGLGRILWTHKENSATTVVWNPWEQGAAGFSDFGKDEWRSMACAEASNILAAAVVLAPGEHHTMRAILKVEPL